MLCWLHIRHVRRITFRVDPVRRSIQGFSINKKSFFMWVCFGCGGIIRFLIGAGWQYQEGLGLIIYFLDSGRRMETDVNKCATCFHLLVKLKIDRSR